MPIARPPGLWIGVGALCFLAALMGTGAMMWSDTRDDGARQAIHDGATGDLDGIRAEYARTHGAQRRRYLFGYPLLFTGLMIVFYIPSLVALERRHPRAESIFLINTFCGPTIIGWGWALKLALVQPRT